MTACVLAPVVPQRGFAAPAEQVERRPARVRDDEGAIALRRHAVVLAAQDQPFGQLLRDGVGDGVADLGRVIDVAVAQKLDDALERIAVSLRGRRCRRDRHRRAQLARDLLFDGCGGFVAAAGEMSFGAGPCGELRIAGRGFGRGTAADSSGAASISTCVATAPSSSPFHRRNRRPRNGFRWSGWDGFGVTGTPGRPGIESTSRFSQYLYCILNVDKNQMRRELSRPCPSSLAKSRPGRVITAGFGQAFHMTAEPVMC